MAEGGTAPMGVAKERAQQYKGRVTPFVVFACLVAATGGSIFGYDIGISGTVTINLPLILLGGDQIHGLVQKIDSVSLWATIDWEYQLRRLKKVVGVLWRPTKREGILSQNMYPRRLSRSLGGGGI